MAIRAGALAQVIPWTGRVRLHTGQRADQLVTVPGTGAAAAKEMP